MKRNSYFCILGVIFSIFLSAQEQQSQLMIQELQQRVQRLEKKLAEQQKELESLRRLRKCTEELKKEVRSLVEQEEIPKNWKTFRTELGLEFHLYLSWTALGTSHVNSLLSPEGDRADASMTLDLTFSAKPVENGTVYLLLEGGSGENTGPNDNIPTFGGIVDESGEETRIRISEAWYEHTFFSEKLRIRVGKVDVTTDFDTNIVANDGTYQFLASPFVNNPAVEFPDFSFGAFIWYSPFEWMSIGYGITDANTDWDQIFDRLFMIWECDFSIRLDPEEKWSGNYRVYFWFNDTKHEDLRIPGRTHSGYGWGMSFDQKIAGMFVIFLRYGHQRERVYEIGDAFSVGVEVMGKIWERTEDALGIGWSHIFPSSTYRTTRLRVADISASNETLLEIYYRLGINKFLTLSIIFQWWRFPQGEKPKGRFTTLGLRGSVYF